MFFFRVLVLNKQKERAEFSLQGVGREIDREREVEGLSVLRSPRCLEEIFLFPICQEKKETERNNDSHLSPPALLIETKVLSNNKNTQNKN